MSGRKTLTYLAAVVCVLLLGKIAVDRFQSPPETPEEQTPVAADRPTPEFPVEYSLGTFDDRFGISKERFLQIAEEAKRIWEDAAGRRLFDLRPDGGMKLNLVFDWRQEKLIEAKEARAKIDEDGRTFDQLQADYNSRSADLDAARKRLDDDALAFKIRLDEYNARVTRWNAAMDHSDAEYSSLQSAKSEIEREQQELERRRNELNTQGDEFNKFGQKLSDLVQKHNLDIESFNGKYVQSRDFEKGLFDGSAINIYEFDKEDDLRLALVHEFGHAIGIGHVENPKSIMYPKLAVQDLSPIHLSGEDSTQLHSRIK